MTFQQFADQVHEWHLEQFGPEVDPSWPLLIAVGELGELAQHYIKREQGVNRTEAEAGVDRDAAIRDAVGDVVIALAGFCGREGVQFGDVVCTAWSEVSKRVYKFEPSRVRFP